MGPNSPPLKRIKLNDGSPSTPDAAAVRLQRSAFLSSLSRSVSPPPQNGRQSKPNDNSQDVAGTSAAAKIVDLISSSPNRFMAPPRHENGKLPETKRVIASPFHLTRSKDLPDSANIDTVTIRNLLGHPLIREAWIFNYCHDVNWTMQQFDPDVRDLVSVKVIHGFWKRDSGGKRAIDKACARHANVQAITAYLPDAFGTHHSKMMVLFRHDEVAQIVIHTANMLDYDWHNATQAAWCSPLLPLVPEGSLPPAGPSRIGSGDRFKQDLTTYLESYGNKLSTLIKSLQRHDFSAVRGALIASVPSKIPSVADSSSMKAWGHVALKRALSLVPLTNKISQPDSKASSTKATVIAQVSSIATFTTSWLHDTLFTSLSPTSHPQPKFSIIFPTPTEVARSLDGYGCGASIHCKMQTAANRRQIDFLRPYLCHWATPDPKAGGAEKKRLNAQRGRAAPHIKTYMRISPSAPAPASSSETQDSQSRIDWALLTSANLSTQAWGTAPKQPSKRERDEEGLTGEFVHIQSYEIGLLVWPGLWAEEDGSAVGVGGVEMVPCFGRDVPPVDNEHEPERAGMRAGRRLGSSTQHDATVAREENKAIVGLRMPFDLPLTPYAPGENPWSPGAVYAERDSHGLVWPANFA